MHLIMSYLCVDAPLLFKSWVMQGKIKEFYKGGCTIAKSGPSSLTLKRSKFEYFNCMFYQLLHVQQSCSFTQFWDGVLPSIVETRDQNSWGRLLLFLNRNLVSFCA